MNDPTKEWKFFVAGGRGQDKTRRKRISRIE
jgi:hypothetical protein